MASAKTVLLDRAKRAVAEIQTDMRLTPLGSKEILEELTEYIGEVISAIDQDIKRQQKRNP